LQNDIFYFSCLPSRVAGTGWKAFRKPVDYRKHRFLCLRNVPYGEVTVVDLLCIMNLRYNLSGKYFILLSVKQESWYYDEDRKQQNQE
jgi:hypothetical protein